MPINILVADDEVTTCRILQEEFQRVGFCVQIAYDGKEAVSILSEGHIDVAVIDIHMPFLDGYQVLQKISCSSETIFLVITAFGSIESAVKAMKLGAKDYVTKPFECEYLINKVRQMISIREKSAEQNLNGDTARGFEETELVGSSGNICEVRRKIEKVKDMKTTVLITGESGTGKGVLAKMIHFSSSRKNYPFVHVDCTAIPAELLESELFGHEKGAFTGAISSHKGKFESAEAGTIFLDEISSLPKNMQAKLLVVLQEKTVYRVGGNKSIKIHARVIAATNEDLREMVRQGRFREDLYYRLNVINFNLLPLRDRKEDIEELVTYFLTCCMQETGKQVEGIQREAMQALISYPWPGNVRELENAVESALVLTDGSTITLGDLPLGIVESSNGGGNSVRQSDVLSEREAEILEIVSALENNNGHREKTARELGISRRTLQYKLRKYNLLDDSRKSSGG